MNRWIAAVAVGGLAWFGVHLSAQRSTALDDTVQVVEGSVEAREDPWRRGATYYALEGRSRRVTTDFADGTRAVAERGVDGDLLARLEGKDANEINRLRVDQMEDADDVVEFVLPLAQPVQLLVKSDVHATLDWANRQSHQFHVDQVASGNGLQWRDGLARRRGGPKEIQELQAVRSVTTEWADGLSAITSPVQSKPGDAFQGTPVRGDVLVTKVMRDGIQIGLANYFTRERIFTWSIGSSEGTIATEHLKSRYGGWLFTPDMEWMNLQSLAMYEWKTAIDEQGFVARSDTSSPIQKVLQFLAPSVSANEPGCDGLHWLDGSVFRFCCEMHDRCYEKYGCSSSSWWQVWSSWVCNTCNGSAVFCFAAGGGGGPFYQSPW